MTLPAPEVASRTLFAFRRNLVVAASAGTGKTHALVGVAVHLLLGGCRTADGALRPPILPDRLVATTFSRRAAGEIRARLRDELERLASGDPRATYRVDLETALLDSPGGRAGIPECAGIALARLARAKIGTLHSFAASIVRSHALLVGLSPDFDLPDEETARVRSVGVIERVLERHARDAEVSFLIRLAGGPAELVELLRHLLTSIAEDGGTAGSLEVADNDAELMDATFRAVVDHARDLRDDARLGVFARTLVLAVERHVSAGRAHGVDATLEDAMGDLWSVPNVGRPSPAAAAFFELRDSLARTTSGAKLRDHGRGFVRAWQARGRALPRLRALKDLLVHCEEEIARDNLTDSVLGFSDILRAARDVLRDNPRVAAETGASFDALLVDEFQDTSRVQRDLVLLLWAKDRRNGDLRAPGTVPSAADVRGEGLLVVGDRKQSIYGFRGADVAVFTELCVGLAGTPAREALGVPAGLVWEPDEPVADFIALRDNYRGKPALLELANAMSRISLVPAALPPELYEVTYVPETEDLLSPARELAASPRTRWLRPVVPSGKKTTSIPTEAEVIAARIAAIVRGGELTLGGAPLRWRDIAVLALRHEMLSATAYMLAEAGIPHVMAGMGFFGAREVRDVVAMLACLVDPDDSLARAEVLRGPWAGVTDRTLVGLTDRHVGLADVTRWKMGERRLLIDPGDRGAVAALADAILSLRPVIARIGAGAALREAVRALNFEETLILLPRGEQRVANVRKLLAMADAATHPTDLLRQLRRADAAEQREGEAATFADEDDAVRLLTVHASKGLAFPVVFLPEAGATGARRSLDAALVGGRANGAGQLVIRLEDDLRSLHDTPSYAMMRRDLARRDAAERRRLRYVAITRASEWMFFVGDRAVPKGSRETYETSSAALLAHLCNHDPSRQTALLDVETGESLLHTAMADPVVAEPIASRTRRLPPAPLPARRVTLPLEALGDAAHCSRRYQLMHATTRAPRDAPLPRDLRARLRTEEGVVRLESDRTLVFAVDRDDRHPALAIVVTAAVTVLRADGSMDLLCRSAPADAASDELYASVLAHAARRNEPSARIRVGFVTADGSPRWVAPQDTEWTRTAVREAADRILSVRQTALADRVPVTVCRRTGCRYTDACYPPEPETPLRRAGPSTGQTAFEFFDAEVRSPRKTRKRVG